MSFTVKEALLAGLIGSLVSAILAFLVNRFAVPMPEQLIEYALGHGVSGLISGFLSGGVGVYLALKKFADQAKA